MDPVFSPPAAVLHIMDRLRENGHDACLVGGCVRDILLGHLPADWDICTAAHPQTVLTLFPGSLDTGAKHGTVTVLQPSRNASGRFPVEVTSWRSETGHSDHRHPDAVRFSDNLETDLSRRDFTINAMAWNPEKGLVDFFHGREDLARGLVRCVGDPMLRFREDALRMLRAVRFCSQLGFELDADAVRAIRFQRDAISFVSRERTQHEMTRTLMGQCPSRASLWWETGLASPMFSEIGTLPDDPGFALSCMDRFPPDEMTNGTVYDGMNQLLPDDAAINEKSHHAHQGDSIDESVFPWAVFWKACGLSSRIGTVSRWMHENRFPRKRAAGVKKLLQMDADGMPDTLRNLRLTALAEGTAWLEASLRLRNLTVGSPVPDMAGLDIPALVLDGNGLMAAIAPLEPPRGQEFGAWMDCLRMSVCENPSCNRADLLGIFATAMASAFQAHS